MAGPGPQGALSLVTETQVVLVRCGKGLLEVRLGPAGRGALEGFLGQRSNLNRALEANSTVTEPTFNVDLIFLFISSFSGLGQL